MLPAFQYSLILGSKSPRRAQLLKEAGFSFTVQTKDVPEDYPATLPVREIAPYLAQRKARACHSFLQHENQILLCADSVVIKDEEVYEKPKDLADAQRMLRELSGHEHEVITGVCLRSLQQEKVFFGVSKVIFAPMSEAEIMYYLTTYQPFDKAGSYGVQEWLGHCKIASIEGTYTNIMGLPVELVYRALSNW